jgi:hypothetical protein
VDYTPDKIVDSTDQTVPFGPLERLHATLHDLIQIAWETHFGQECDFLYLRKFTYVGGEKCVDKFSMRLNLLVAESPGEGAKTATFGLQLNVREIRLCSVQFSER